MNGPNDKQAYSDASGLETLEHLSAAHQFNDWLFSQILPFCKGEVMEAGSGIGNISELLLEQGFHTTLSDIRPEYLKILEEKFNDNPCFHEAYRLDLSDPEIELHSTSLLGRFDTLVALNVIEHIAQDALAIRNARKLLKPGGRLVVLVPAGAWLFNQFDRELSHFRRYDRNSLSKLLEEQGFNCRSIRYFNLAGIAGWWFFGSLLKRKQIPAGQLKIFDRLVPFFRFLDWSTGHLLGLSIIAIGTKGLHE
ncbi:MAG TPA: class I SAM-dependent methyltransferase [Puia sp.]|nr:class I SAM-dependent methyltransferase [Puia sp.]